MTTYNKVFFHAGPACACTGIGALFSELDAANIQFGHKTADEYGTAWEAAQYANATTVWRLTTAGQNDGRQYDVPDYSLPPADAALKHWLITKEKLPPEFNKNTWIEPINEVDKNRADWLGYFALAIAMMANGEGYKVSLFAFSSGEPEQDAWETPGMLAYLRYAADHPEEAAVSLHEYSLTTADLFEGFPYLVGRFQFLHDVCDDNDIARPTIFISEFGWEYQHVPAVEQAMKEIDQAAELYAKHPNIRLAAVWYLGGGENWPDIGQETQRLIEPVKQYTLTARFPDPPEPPNGGEPVTTIKTAVFGTAQGLSDKKVTALEFQYAHTEDKKNLIWSARVPLDLAALIPDLAEIDLREIRLRVPVELDCECDENPNPPPSVLTLPAGSKGVDVSYWQGSYNWADSGAEFGITRCSDGMTANSTTHDENGIDRQFWANADKLTALGIPWAIYHFLRPGSIQAQADKVRGALLQLAQNGTLPQTAVFDNGVNLPSVFIDVEDGNLTSTQVLEFYSSLVSDFAVGIYTGKPIWESITNNMPVWWSDVPLWIAAYGANDGNVPNWPDGPNLPRGWSKALLWQYTSIPLDKNIAGPYPPENKPPTPPQGQTVDITPYFKPSSQFGRYVVFHFDDGRTQPQQMELLPDGRTILWKGEGQTINGKLVYDYEEMYMSPAGVEKEKDTSSGGSSAYDLDGVIWLPKIVEVGKVYESIPLVRTFDRVTCETKDISETVDYIYVKELLPTWTSPIDPSITFSDVLVCEWRKTSDITTPPLEVYKLAPDVCYVAWNDGAVGELPQGRQPLSFQLTDCE